MFCDEFAKPNSHACAQHNKVGDGEVHSNGYSVHVHHAKIIYSNYAFSGEIAQSSIQLIHDNK